MRIAFLVLSSLLANGAAFAKLNVVVTTPDLGSIARAIGADDIDLTILARPTEDPHFVDAKPSFVVKLNRADVLVEGGAELEVGWLPALVRQARNSKIDAGAPGHVLANRGVEMLEMPSSLDRSLGDIHAAGNPHYLMDPENAIIVARNLAEAFSKSDPALGEKFKSRLETFTGDLRKQLAAWQKRLEPCRDQCIVAYHNSWVYFGRRFGFKINLFLEPKPGIPPTPSHLADVITRMKEQHAHIIIVDYYLDQRTAEAVASRTGASTVRVSQFPGAIKGTEGGYVELMNYLVDSLAKAFDSHPENPAPK